MILQKIDESSGESVPSAVNIFHTESTDVTAPRYNIKEFLTLNPVTDFPLHFKIFAGSDYSDLDESALVTEFYAEWYDPADHTWKAITAAENISCVQMFGSTFIRNMKIKIEGREIVNTNNLYAYKTVMEKVLSISEDGKKTHLALSGFYQDNVDQNDPLGTGFIKRRNLWVNRNRVQFVTTIDVDLFKQHKYFLNHTEMDIEIYPNSNEFLALAPNLPNGGRVRFVMTSCKLRMTFPELTDGLALGIARTLLMQPAKYAMRKIEMKSVYLEAGRTEANINLFTDRIPRRVIVGMVANADYNGNYRTSPFKFQPFDIRNIHIDWNGQKTPSIPFELNFDNNVYMTAYYEMMRNCGFFNNPHKSNGITLDMYKESHCFFVFNTTSTLKNTSLFELVKPGNTSLYTLFNTAIPAGGISLVVYAEYDSVLKIDNYRNATFDL